MVQIYSRTIEPLKNTTSAKRKGKYEVTQKKLSGSGICSAIQQCLKRNDQYLIPLSYLCHHSASRYAVWNNLGWGEGCWRNPFQRMPEFSSARRCHPPAAAINTTQHLDTRQGAPRSIAALPSSSKNKKSLLTTLLQSVAGSTTTSSSPPPSETV